MRLWFWQVSQGCAPIYIHLSGIRQESEAWVASNRGNGRHPPPPNSPDVRSGRSYSARRENSDVHSSFPHLPYRRGGSRSFFPPAPKFPAPRIPESDVEQANDRLRRMAILAGSEGGLPACRNATRPRQPAPPAFNSSTQPNPSGRGCGGAYPSCRQPQRMPPAEADPPRQGEWAGWLVMTSSSVLIISPTPIRNLTKIILQ